MRPIILQQSAIEVTSATIKKHFTFDLSDIEDVDTMMSLIFGLSEEKNMTVEEIEDISMLFNHEFDEVTAYKVGTQTVYAVTLNNKLNILGDPVTDKVADSIKAYMKSMGVDVNFTVHAAPIQRRML